MSEATLTLNPQVPRSRGLVPRGAMALVLGGLLIVAALLYVHSLPAGTDATLPEDVVKRQLASKELIDSQVPGNPALVDEMAEQARRKEPASTPQAIAPSVPASMPAMTDLPRWPALTPDLSPRERGADALRQAEKRNETYGAAALLFDETAVPGEPAGGRRVNAGPEALTGIDALLRRATAAGDAALSPGGLSEAIKQMTSRQALPGPAALAKSWAEQQEGPSTVMALHASAPGGRWVLMEGTIIPAVTTRALNSDLPGVVSARVSQDVYDSRSSRILLLPKGALLVGRYNNQVDFGQERLQFAFTRLRMPDGSAFDLPGAAGADAAGRSGVEGDVNRHLLKTLGSAILMGMLADRVVRPAAVPPAGLGGGGLSATGQILVDTAKTELERLRATPTTITIPEGTRIHVEVVRDLAFPGPYRERGF